MKRSGLIGFVTKGLLLFVVALVSGCHGSSEMIGCDGQPCSGHGRCETTSQGPRCVCDTGFVPNGLTCISQAHGERQVDPSVSTPDAGISTARDGSSGQADGRERTDTSARDGDASAGSDANSIPSCVARTASELREIGPYEVTNTRIAEGNVVVYRPEQTSACRMPVAHFSNGTFAFCGYYKHILRHLASHGYLVACHTSSQTGSGQPCLDAITAVSATYADEIYTDRFLSLGHSQGGGAAHSCQFLLERQQPSTMVVSVGIQPAHGMNRQSYETEYPQIRGPVLMISGSADVLVSDDWVERGFDLIASEKYWYEAVGATHFNPHSWAATAGLAFGQWKLFADDEAGAYFEGLLDDQTRWRGMP
jgi:hypothetical protein